MTRAEGRAASPGAAALEDRASVLELTRDLVRIPSRGGIDPYEPVLDCMASWLAAHRLGCRRLAGPGGAVVALASEVTGAGPGPRYVLDACLDTAPFGDESAWTRPPTSGYVYGGWPHGRGSSDSKAGAAIFAHVIARLKQAAAGWAGSVVLLLDVDEHTGGTAGARAFFGDPGAPRADGVMIGYPGPGHVVTGGRGVLRAQLHVHGTAGHSGSSSAVTPSAVEKAAALVTRLRAGTRPTGVELTTAWPPYALPSTSPLRTALLEAARSAGLAPQAKVAGPSNIGNYLAGLGIPATAGFGVDYEGLHGTDERIRADSVPPVQAAYHQAPLSLLPAA